MVIESTQVERVDGWKRVDDIESCGTKTLRIWLRFFNGLVCISGLGLISSSIYLSTSGVNLFAGVVGGIGVYVFLTGILGLYMIGRSGRGKYYFYIFIFLILILFESVLIIGIFFFLDKTIEILNNIDTNGRSDIDQFRNLLENNNWLAIVLVVLAALQVFSLVCVLCCRRHVIKDEEDDELVLQWRSAIVTEETVARNLRIYDENDDKQNSKNNGNNNNTNRNNHSIQNSDPLLPTPHTNSQRDRMNEKYGGLWSKQKKQLLVD